MQIIPVSFSSKLGMHPEQRDRRETWCVPTAVHRTCDSVNCNCHAGLFLCRHLVCDGEETSQTAQAAVESESDRLGSTDDSPCDRAYSVMLDSVFRRFAAETAKSLASASEASHARRCGPSIPHCPPQHGHNTRPASFRNRVQRSDDAACNVSLRDVQTPSFKFLADAIGNLGVGICAGKCVSCCCLYRDCLALIRPKCLLNGSWCYPNLAQLFVVVV